MRILIPVIGYAWRSGSEIVVRDTALGLTRRGHETTVFSHTLGPLAEETRRAGVAVVDSLDDLAATPDVIHAQHVLPTVEAFVRFPSVPAVWTCHDSVAWHDEPLLFPQIRRYVGMDEACRDRILATGAPAKRTLILRNAVDLARIPPRPASLPDRPRRAAAFGKAAAESSLLQAVCGELGLDYFVVGGETGTDKPERELVEADIVFATARAAIEAMACGCAVVLIDARGAGGLVASGDYERLRDRNFGLRALTKPVSAQSVRSMIEAYDRADAERVCRQIRHDADVELRLDRIEALHADIVREGFNAGTHAAARDAAMETFLRQLTPHPQRGAGWPWERERDGLLQRIEGLERRLSCEPRTADASPRGANDGHPVLNSFVSPVLPLAGDEMEDWMGVRSKTAWVGAPEHPSWQPRRVPPPVLNEEYFEWVDLLEAVNAAEGTFTMAELGAGWGRWSLRGAQAARQKALPFRLILVEAEPVHVQFIRKALALNGVEADSAEVWSGAMGAEGAKAPFTVSAEGLDARNWYGQALYQGPMAPTARRYADQLLFTSPSGVGLIETPTLTLEQVLGRHEKVDLLDVSLSGAEAALVRGSFPVLAAKVRRVHLRTGSPEAEGALREAFAARGWRAVWDFPAGSTVETPFGPCTFCNGLQSWRNPA